MAAAESPLVPASTYGGGALIAVDANGQEAKLSLREYKVDVHIEDGFARTTIDQTYFNHHPWRLEGTFYFPLPPDASLSRLAMYVDDGHGAAQLMEGGMAERQHARSVYQKKIVNNQRDPALLEWVDGSTFKDACVSARRPSDQAHPAQLHARNCRSCMAAISIASPPATACRWSATGSSTPSSRMAATSWPSVRRTCRRHERRPPLVARSAATSFLGTAAHDTQGGPRRRPRPEPHLILATDDTKVRFVRFEHEGADYFALRYRPALAGRPERQRRDWVFLVETSAPTAIRCWPALQIDIVPQPAGQRRTRRHLPGVDRRQPCPSIRRRFRCR